MSKLFSFLCIVVLMSSCTSTVKKNETVKTGIVYRATRVYQGGSTHMLICLTDGKMLHNSDVFSGQDEIQKASFAQAGDTVYYNGNDKIIDVHFSE